MNSTRLIVDSCLIFVLSVAGIAPEVHSDLYVSTDGKDSNPGDNREAPPNHTTCSGHGEAGGRGLCEGR